MPKLVIQIEILLLLLLLLPLLRLWLSATSMAMATATYYITIISIYYVGSFERDVRSNQVANRDQPLFFPKKSNIKINY